jgi:hypothetical protein
VLWGSGRVGREIVVSFSVAVLMIVVLALASSISVVAMAWGVWLVYLIRSVWITVIVSTLLGIPAVRSLSMLRGGLLVGALTAAVLFGADRGLAELGLAPLVRLGLAMALGAVLLPLLALLLVRVILPPEIKDVMQQMLARLPERVQRWLGQHCTSQPDMDACPLRAGKQLNQ